MNIHHLELFYYVARYHGISSAARQMPYGIQQPAMSSQIRQLEKDLGTRLFDRSPFRLTHAGGKLMEFVRPFFSNLDAVAAGLGKQPAPLLRIGAGERMLRDYLPPVLQQLRTVLTNLQVNMRSGFTHELETALRQQEIDLAIVAQDGPPRGFHHLVLIRLPLVLLVPDDSAVTSAAELWAMNRIDVPLICLPDHEVISRIFARGLKRLWVDWACGVAASSLDLVPQYVLNGYGYGVTVQVPGVALQPNVRVLPLEGFDHVDVDVLWLGTPSPLIQTFLTAAREFAAGKQGNVATPKGRGVRPAARKHA